MKVVFFYELLKPNQTITAERYQQQLIDFNRVLNQKCSISLKKTQSDFVTQIMLDQTLQKQLKIH